MDDSPEKESKEEEEWSEALKRERGSDWPKRVEASATYAQVTPALHAPLGILGAPGVLWTRAVRRVSAAYCAG